MVLWVPMPEAVRHRVDERFDANFLRVRKKEKGQIILLNDLPRDEAHNPGTDIKVIRGYAKSL